MDKRTILFVLSLTLTLFLVNMFFEHRGSEDKRKWQEQQQAKKQEKLVKLQAEVKQRTVPVAALPVVNLYADVDGQKLLGTAVESNGAYLTVAWDTVMPKELYVAPASHAQKTTAVTLAMSNTTRGAPTVYVKGEKSKLQIATLPDLGKFDLQLVVPSATDSNVYLGEYVDGHFHLPAEKLATAPVAAMPLAIALMKVGDVYRPVGIYNSDSRLFEPLNAIPALSDFLAKQEQSKVPVGQPQGEQFYVLETPYQQLVFSNVGGALAEINLPFQSKEDKRSVVKEIEIDREMVAKHPYNAHFPAHPYFTPSEGDKGEFTQNSVGTLGGYYPLLRRDLIESDRRRTVRVKPKYYALNIVSEYPETAELTYTVKSFDKEKIVFEAMQGHRKIIKTYSVASETQAPYSIDLTIDIEGDSRGLWLTSGVPEVEWISGAPAPTLKYRITRNQQSVVENIDLPKDITTVTSSAVDWVADSNGFFGTILDPLSDTEPGYRAQMVSGTVVPSRLVEIEGYKAEDLPGYMMYLPLKSSGGSMHFRVFAGPFASTILNTVDHTYANPATGYNPDYIASQTFHGWFAFISEPFAKFLFVLMNFFHTLTGSWAFSIILLTVALRVMLYPLNAWSTKSMVKMQQIAPEVTAIQEKYKKDPKKAQLEIMNLYRDKGVNPVSGCFPLLIQMPFLIGMFDLLKSTFELRGTSFIPGWINDLTAPDVLFSWNMHIPLIGNQFHLLPILLGVVMFAQQQMMSNLPKDKSLWTEQQRQQRVMGNIMAIVFTVMFYNFPSGLNIYWLSSMILGMIQQWWTTKRMNKEKEAAKVEVLPAPKVKKKA